MNNVLGLEYMYVQTQIDHTHENRVVQHCSNWPWHINLCNTQVSKLFYKSMANLPVTTHEIFDQSNIVCQALFSKEQSINCCWGQ